MKLLGKYQNKTECVTLIESVWPWGTKYKVRLYKLRKHEVDDNYGPTYELSDWPCLAKITSKSKEFSYAMYHLQRNEMINKEKKK